MMKVVKLTGHRARVQRYRSIHRGIDYVPSHDVLPIIAHHLKNGTDTCLAGVIDYLIRSGQQAITGNGGEVMRRRRGFLPPASCQQCGKAPHLGQFLWPGDQWLSVPSVWNRHCRGRTLFPSR